MEKCNIFSWNVRGMNKGNKQRDIRDLCRLNNIGFGALFETKVRHEKAAGIISNSFPNWDYYSSSVISYRILLIWQSKFVQVQILDEDPQFVHCKIRVSGHKTEFFLTAVYGSNSILERKVLWDKLARLGHLNLPWIVLGDFNAMFSYQDRNGGTPITPKEVSDAKNWLSLGQLDEIRYAGSSYTWFKDTVLDSWNKPTTKEGLAGIIQKLYRVKHVLKKFQKKDLGDIPHSYQKRRAENRITSYVVNDEVIDDFDKVVEHYFNHFRNFMGKKSSTNKEIDINCLKFGEKLTIKLQVKLIRPFSMKEVKEAMFGIHSIKSPGPDGFGAGFFKGLWNEIGNDISMAVINFFRDGVLPNELNETDLLKGYTRKKISARCIMKIDLSKAYDTVDCRLHGTFRGEKGLRQGDPISPLLFVLIMEYLSRLLLQTSEHKGFDDLVIFCKGNEESMSLTQSAIKSFCDTIGLSINNTKFHIYFGGINDECKTKLLEIAQMEEGSFPLKYLGVHLRPTKWRAADCGGIIDKIQRSLHSWASRNLSFAGRAQLIHSVLLGIRNFWMSIFILPQKVVAAIDKSCRDFLWGLKGNRSKLHLTSWDQVCLPKKYGGIGFFEGRKWNIAMMAKHIWAISSKQDCLWVKWIDSIYLKGQSFWSVPLKNDTSWYFQKFLKLRNVIDCAAVTSSGLRGKFKANSFYLSLIAASKVHYASAIWHRLCVPKHRFISWQAMNDHLLTRDHLGKIMELASYYCPVCESVIETHQHLFFYCTFTKNLLQDVSSWSGFSGWPSNIEAWKIRCTKTCSDLLSSVWNAILSAVFYSVWCNRNRCVFDLCCSSVKVVSSSIKLAIKARVKGINCTKAKKRERDVIGLINSL
ncbi:uncharacterized protein LOC133785250 [Humulus lupulus]|uniref:uncharacterized protein LOC133785250 n=1 Tax=Humulus lupulus TaxID=3486 RepID=UPI002B4037CA|nr:uncharacterized protein LOC133785250 [Humulus lupulus]